MTRNLVHALYDNAIDNGTISWDVTLSKNMSILLIATLACRTGDITKARLDKHKLPFLCWNDVTIIVKDSKDVHTITGRVVIRNEKEHKSV